MTALDDLGPEDGELCIKYCKDAMQAIDTVFFKGTLQQALVKAGKPIELVLCDKEHTRSSVTIMHTEGGDQGRFYSVNSRYMQHLKAQNLVMGK